MKLSIINKLKKYLVACMAVFSFASSCFAFGPFIPITFWRTVSTGSRCHDECRKRTPLGCIQWVEVCDNRTHVIDKFDLDDEEILKGAFEHFDRALTSPIVEKCVREGTQKYDPYNKTDHANLIEKDINALFRAPRWIRVNLHPKKESPNGPDVLGNAPIERVAFGFEFVGDPLMAANGGKEVHMKLYTKSMKTYAAEDKAATMAIMAGIIAHEYTHQMGYNHGRGNYYDSNFSTVLQDCIASYVDENTDPEHRGPGPYGCGRCTGLTLGNGYFRFGVAD